MRQRITIIVAILVFLLVVVLMVRDMYHQKELTSNPYEYSVDNYKHIDADEFCYELGAEIIADFNNLNAISIDFEDKIFIADSNTVHVFNKKLEAISKFNIESEINCIYSGDKGRIYLGIGDHVEVWSMEGKRLEVWDPFDEKSIITSIISTDLFVCVADAGKKLLLLYDHQGILIKEMGKKDGLERKLGFVIPSPYFDVDVSREGHFWATNPGMHSLEAYDFNGRMISSWKKTSMQMDGFSGCCNPTHFAFLSDGSFVTSEKGLVRIKIHEPTGDYRCAVDGPLSFDEKETGLDIAVNSEDEIFVLLPSEKKIRKYIRK